MEKLKIGRTKSATILEALTAFITLANVVLLVSRGLHLDGWHGLMVDLLVCAGCCVALLVLAYHPTSSLVNMPVKIQTAAQQRITSHTFRILAVEVALLSLLISAVAIFGSGNSRSGSGAIIIGMSMVVVLTVAVSTVLLRRAR